MPPVSWPKGEADGRTEPQAVGSAGLRTECCRGFVLVIEEETTGWIRPSVPGSRPLTWRQVSGRPARRIPGRAAERASPAASRQEAIDVSEGQTVWEATMDDRYRVTVTRSASHRGRLRIVYTTCDE